MYLNTSDNSPTPHMQSVYTYEKSIQPSHTETSEETDKIQNNNTCTYITCIWVYHQLDMSVTSQETDKIQNDKNMYTYSIILYYVYLAFIPLDGDISDFKFTVKTSQLFQL